MPIFWELPLNWRGFERPLLPARADRLLGLAADGDRLPAAPGIDERGGLDGVAHVLPSTSVLRVAVGKRTAAGNMAGTALASLTIEQLAIAVVIASRSSCFEVLVVTGDSARVATRRRLRSAARGRTHCVGLLFFGQVAFLCDPKLRPAEGLVLPAGLVLWGNVFYSWGGLMRVNTGFLGPAL